MKTKQVELTFKNKKGEIKKVKFPIDSKTYEILLDESIDEEYRQKYLVDEYHEYERERYYKRKFVSFDSEMAESLDLIEDNSIFSEQRVNKFINKTIDEEIKKLTPRQQEIVRLLYWEGKTQKDLCEIYGIKKQAISDAVKRIHNTLRKKLK